MAKIYYKSIINGSMTINNVPDRWKDDVKNLFKADVKSGKISEEYYEQATGEKYKP